MKRIIWISLLGFSCGHDPPNVIGNPPIIDGSVDDDAVCPMPEAGLAEAGGEAGMSSSEGGGYPAPHPSPPTLTSLGGPILKTPTIYPVFFANEDDKGFETKITSFLTALAKSSYWKTTTAEYGVGVPVLKPSIHLPAAAAMLKDAEIQGPVQKSMNANDGQFPTADENTLIAFFYPSATMITDASGSTSCDQFGGYHSSLQLDAAHSNRNVAYAVFPRCPFFNSLVGFNIVTVTTSHELIEAATDPYPRDAPAYNFPDADHRYWGLAFSGGEAVDLCAQGSSSVAAYGGPDFNFLVSKSWSNAAAAAGRNPCVPQSKCSIYFNSVPVLSDIIDNVMHGVKIAVGQTRTIEVDLFSTGPTDPWSVQVGTFTNTNAGKLTTSLDRSNGKNGDKLQLTITVDQPGTLNHELFYLLSTLGSEQNIWIGLVGN